MKKAIILLSGGLDSTTALAYAKNQGFNCYVLSFNYGQKHLYELEAAKRIAKLFQVTEHKIIALPYEAFNTSALTNQNIPVPDYVGDGKIPSTYVPARNTIFLAFALGYAETMGAFDIFTGACNLDYSGYVDCRPEFMAAFENLANLATNAGVEGNNYTIHTPLMNLTKAQTVKLGQQLGVDYSLTVTCYRADPVSGAACGTCDSCTYRKKGFAEAGIADPTFYG